MTAILAHRLELAGARDHGLDADLLHWLAEDVGMGQSEIWLRHARGLVGDLSGAKRLVDGLFPGARWALSAHDRAASVVFYAALFPAGSTTIFDGSSGDAANALLAAIVRAFLASAEIGPFADNDRGVAA